MKFSKVQRQFSSAVIWSLFFMTMCLGAQPQDDIQKRVAAETFPLTVSAPSDWEVFTSNAENPNEILFLQTPEKAPYGVTVSFSTHPVTGNWDELIGRQSYHLLVWDGVPLIVNEPLKLKGAQGHKWVYRDKGPNGESKVYYRLYLLLPGSVGDNRLLLMQGSAPAEHSPEIVPRWNSMARSLAWGLSAESLED
jgi:hypothetical protein